MHESSLMRGLFRQIEEIAENNQARRVSVVRLRLGPLALIEPDHLREHFAEASVGTLAENALLEIELTDDLHEMTLESIDIEAAEELKGEESCSRKSSCHLT